MLRLSLLLLCVPLLQACNLTTFAEWRTETYDGVLIEDKGFWRYSATEVQLSKALALDLAYSKCAAQFNNLIVFQAGLHGPITIQTAYDVMCSSVCIEVDKIVQEAMFVSECSCLQLSTQPGDFSYHGKGDLCHKNTGRILCKYGFCGNWECRLDDFMCPRYEFNKRVVDTRGPGSCLSSAAPSSSRAARWMGALASMCIGLAYVVYT